MSTKNFEERITTRYNKSTKTTYDQVMDLVKENSIPKATAQLLLVQRGLVHTNNPEPLIKEVEKKVYVDRPVEKKVYVDRPVYIKSDQANVKGQRASDDKLTNPNKAKSGPSSSKLALEEKKSSNDGTSIGGWIALLGLFIGIPVAGYLWNTYITK